MNKNDFEKIDSIVVSRVGSFADAIQHKLITVAAETSYNTTVIRSLDVKFDAVAARTFAEAGNPGNHRMVQKRGKPSAL